MQTTPAPFEVNCRKPLERAEAGGLVQQAQLFQCEEEARAWMVSMYNAGWSVWFYVNGRAETHWGPVLQEHDQ